MKGLDEFIKSNPDSRELKRALAVRMSIRGYRHREIMESLQVSSGFISKWKQTFIINGVEGLKRAYQGSRGYLSKSEKQKVLKWLERKTLVCINKPCI